MLFASATVASSAAYFLPAMAYVAGFYGQQHARHRDARATEPGTPPAPPATRNPSAATNSTFDPGGPATGVGAGDLGSGKTQSVIMPSVAFAPGAVVSTSMKAEVLATTHVVRSLRGKCWLFDPGGTTVPARVIGLRWNPLCDVTDWDSARSVAARLTGPARAGARASHDGDHWTDRAETWLEVLLYAARLSTCDGDLAALARWSMNPTGAGPECEAILIVAGEDGDAVSRGRPVS